MVHVSWHFHILPICSVTFLIGCVVSSSNDHLVCVKYVLKGSGEKTQWLYFFRNSPFFLQPIMEGPENAALGKTALSLSFQKYQRNVQKWKKIKVLSLSRFKQSIHISFLHLHLFWRMVSSNVIVSVRVHYKLWSVYHGRYHHHHYHPAPNASLDTTKIVNKCPPASQL